ncbi:MAG: endonuclease domain-containing protein [Candidatus Dojkabacteria bacterium]
MQSMEGCFMISYRNDLKLKASFLRRHPTLGERMLWKRLRKKQTGYDFHRQKPLLNYIVDFYCHSLGLIIELDGISHTSKGDYDLFRQDNLESIGLSILRFTEKEVIQDIKVVCLRIDWCIEVFEYNKKHPVTS